MRLLITSILIFLSIESNCRNEGIIRGRIIDSETKDPLIGANVGIKGSSKGTITDLEEFKLLSPWKTSINNLLYWLQFKRI